LEIADCQTSCETINIILKSIASLSLEFFEQLAILHVELKNNLVARRTFANGLELCTSPLVDISFWRVSVQKVNGVEIAKVDLFNADRLAMRRQIELAELT
jgi:hypothetical protein